MIGEFLTQCLDCLRGQSENLCRMAGVEFDEPVGDRIAALRAAAVLVAERFSPPPGFGFLTARDPDPKTLSHRQLLEAYIEENPSCDFAAAGYYAAVLYPAAALGGNPDPYVEIKRRADNAVAPMALDCAARLRDRFTPELIADTLIPWSLGANMLQDYGRAQGLDNLDQAAEILDRSAREFAQNTLADERHEFLDALARARTLLLVPDNAGEFLFDALLLRALKLVFPQLRIMVAGRARVVNDITGDEIQALIAQPELAPIFMIGGEPVFEIIPTDQLPGTFSLLSARNPELGRLLESEGLVMLCKGQANLEVIPVIRDLKFPGFIVELDAVETYLLAKAKCVPARAMLKRFSGLDFDPADPRWESFAPGVAASRASIRAAL